MPEETSVSGEEIALKIPHKSKYFNCLRKINKKNEIIK
jgi:hypothetical protein